jgi:hypothetical protein
MSFLRSRRKSYGKTFEKEAREELGDDYKFIEAGREVTLDSIMERFAVEARLDAMLDAHVKRLLHLRGLT